LVFYARTSSPLPALATIPLMQSLKLTLWTDQVDTFDDFPQIGGAWMLQIHLPQEHDSVAVSTTLKEQFPDCNIVVWDNFR
jgi:hypothetical protein